VCLLLLPVLVCASVRCAAQTAQPAGISLPVDGGVLQVECVTNRIVHVTYRKEAAATHASLVVLPQTPQSQPCVNSSDANAMELRSSSLRVTVDRSSGRVRFLRAGGEEILAERAGPRVEPATVMGERTFHVQQQWQGHGDESLYGLGQQQLGVVDIKGLDLDMWQHNTNVVVPFLVSSRGYGILWDNLSYSRFGDLRPFEPVPANLLLNEQGTAGGLGVLAAGSKGGPFQTPDIRIDLPSGAGARGLKNLRFAGFLEAPGSGQYQLKTYSNGGIRVTFDEKVIIDHWRQGWLASDDQVRVDLKAGQRYPIVIETDAEQQSTMRFLWKTPAPDPATSLWSEVGDALDYYFVYGPSPDDVISGYRQLTGRATMLPAWSFGLWQSRQRYETAQQSLDVVHEFRRREIPFDNIVQDWQYWRPDSWGSQEFDPARFSDPDGWIKAIHDAHANVMISVWGKFNPNTANAKEMQARGYLFQPNLKENLLDWIGYPYTFYDAFNPGARKLFWSQIDTHLFRKGIDAWWMDATEPDLLPSPPTLEAQQSHMNPTALGTGARVLNGYALENSAAIYEGQRASAPNQRVFTLTRSGFAGQQRYSAVTWSGDTTSTWTAMKKQIAAGLGFGISGVPYWTMDAGGYTMQRRFEHPSPADDEEWRELNVRWFQFAAFCPFLRVHGELRSREMWSLGDETSAPYRAELKYDKLRYRLFPYIYSVAGSVTQRDQTMMRPLVMDFEADSKAREIADEYMFGPAFLVAPVTTYKARSREVYLPGSALWYSLDDGASHKGGTTFDAPAAFDQLPVFVRAGSIVPTGPEEQWIGEKAAETLSLHIYAGADGDFTLYEDQGTTFDYEKGAYSEVHLHWDDARRRLEISPRKGSFAGMLQQRTFLVQLVTAAQPRALLGTEGARTIRYTGAGQTLSLQ
jgi:alpha-D-xyloside xylohydrolase